MRRKRTRRPIYRIAQNHGGQRRRPDVFFAEFFEPYRYRSLFQFYRRTRHGPNLYGESRLYSVAFVFPVVSDVSYGHGNAAAVGGVDEFERFGIHRAGNETESLFVAFVIHLTGAAVIEDQIEPESGRIESLSDEIADIVGSGNDFYRRKSFRNDFYSDRQACAVIVYVDGVFSGFQRSAVSGDHLGAYSRDDDGAAVRVIDS